VMELDIMTSNQDSHAELVFEIRSETEPVEWTTAHFSDFYHQGNDQVRIYKVIRFRNNHLKTQNLICKAYIWNRNHETFGIRNFLLKVRKGNPYLYGLYEPVSKK
jgi:hypothetical protein